MTTKVIQARNVHAGDTVVLQSAAGRRVTHHVNEKHQGPDEDFGGKTTVRLVLKDRFGDSITNTYEPTAPIRLRK